MYLYIYIFNVYIILTSTTTSEAAKHTVDGRNPANQLRLALYQFIPLFRTGVKNVQRVVGLGISEPSTVVIQDVSMVLVPRPTPMFEVKVLLALFTYQFWPLAALFLLRVTVPKGNKKKRTFRMVTNGSLKVVDNIVLMGQFWPPVAMATNLNVEYIQFELNIKWLDHVYQSDFLFSNNMFLNSLRSERLIDFGPLFFLTSLWMKCCD